MFTSDMLSRLLWAATIIWVGLVLWWLVNRQILLRAGKNSSLAGATGVPSVLYFTTPTCAPCKTFQRPALERLQQTLGDCLKVIEVDATAQPQLATQWGVLSVPTTFILDAQGTPRHVNHGPTGTEKLLQQLTDL